MSALRISPRTLLALVSIVALLSACNRERRSRSSSADTSDIIIEAPPLDPGERITRIEDGSCELMHSDGRTRDLAGCPATIRRGTASLVRRYDGLCFIDYDCASRDSHCNPPEPDEVPCPAGSAPVIQAPRRDSGAVAR